MPPGMYRRATSPAFRYQARRGGETVTTIAANLRAGPIGLVGRARLACRGPGCGERHTVTVVPGGYIWRETTYASLSTIARAITGTAWNGPRFFGLRTRRDQSGVLAKRPAVEPGRLRRNAPSSGQVQP